MIESNTLVERCIIDAAVVHHIGNKPTDEGIIFSKSTLNLDANTRNSLLTWFFSSFRFDEYYNLYHDSDLKLNEVFSYVSQIFEDPDTLFDQSVNLSKHLYEQSNHPKIKVGELFVVYFQDCPVGNETVDAVGLFKTETKDTFLRVLPVTTGFTIESELGFNINKLDKGCLIFNSEAEKGYLVSIVDSVNRSTDAQYWVDQFLHLQPRNDEYYQTKNVLNLCKSFVVNRMPEEFEVSKADQVEMLNKSVKFFKESEEFDMDDFANEVLSDPGMIGSFKSYKSEFEQDKDIQITDKFSISEAALKKQSRVFKSIIKLDKNFHIYIHGDKQNIVKGFDPESGMHFYQLFFREES
ncbi:MAG: nucleoid-associated protein [Bacteroidetes bacterium]|nr:nucleoid-associated protein [Bacteroidota bacterium]